MFGFDIVAVGKLTDKFISDGCENYLKRLRPYAGVSVAELPAVPPKGEGEANILAALGKEGTAILQRVPQGAKLVALCIEGGAMSSQDFAAYIQKEANAGCSRFVFAIGSSHGLSDEVKSRADLRLSLSPMTFPHELARLMLCEQLYRATAILNNLKYHK